MMAACETAPVVIEDLPSVGAGTTRELLILPLTGLSPTVGGAVGEKMAWGLREAGYPARSTRLSNNTNPMLTGWIEEANNGGDVIWLNINWTLYGSGGTLIGNYRQETAVSRDGWSRLSPDTLAVIVTQAVPAIHEIAEIEIFPDGMPSVAPASAETTIIELMPPKQETIVVSGDGLSRIDASGNEIADQPLSIATEPTFAPDYNPEATVAGGVEEQAEQVIQVEQNNQEGFPEGFASGMSARPVSEGDSTATTGLSMDTGPAMATTESKPGGLIESMEDDVGRLTPESAALVTTLPELTISQPIFPVQNSISDSTLMEPESVPDPKTVALAPGVSQQSTVMAPQVPPQVPQVSMTPAAPANLQPALANGNAALGFVRPVFLVRNISGAPGDGNIALRTALLQSLRGADAMVTDNPMQASYVIQGSVQVAAPFAGRQHTRIVWLVTTIGGEEVGTAIQENDIPQGSLDGRWGEVAQIITNAAIPGVTRLFDTRLDAGSAQGNLSQPDLPHVLGDPEP